MLVIPVGVQDEGELPTWRPLSVDWAQPQQTAVTRRLQRPQKLPLLHYSEHLHLLNLSYCKASQGNMIVASRADTVCVEMSWNKKIADPSLKFLVIVIIVFWRIVYIWCENY